MDGARVGSQVSEARGLAEEVSDHAFCRFRRKVGLPEPGSIGQDGDGGATEEATAAWKGSLSRQSALKLHLLCLRLLFRLIHRACGLPLLPEVVYGPTP